MLPSEFRCIMSNYNNVFQSNSNTLLGQLICDKTTPMQLITMIIHNTEHA